MEIRSPRTEAEWEAYYALRYVILRKPWNQKPGSERDELEEVSTHFAAFQGPQLVGVGRLDVRDEVTAQIRFMAIDYAFQGTGVGRKLMEAMEDQAWRLGSNTIVLHAREKAVAFYTKLGYEGVQPSHCLFGEIQHFLMQKKKG
jgi:GNAT superfamily N-acetyltransferase